LHLHLAMFWHPRSQTASRNEWIQAVIRLSDIGTIVVFLDRPPGGPVQILVLAAFQGPQKCHEPQPAEKKSNRNEIDEDVHASRASRGGAPRVASTGSLRSARASRLSRSALATTMIDDVDMATAAISGVAYPARAIGTAKTL